MRALLAVFVVAAPFVMMFQAVVVLLFAYRLRFVRRVARSIAEDNQRLRLELSTATPLFSRRLLEAAVRDLRTENAVLRRELEVRRALRN